MPGDDCPIVWGECSHPFHMHCIVKWINSQVTTRCRRCERAPAHACVFARALALNACSAQRFPVHLASNLVRGCTFVLAACGGEFVLHA